MNRDIRDRASKTTRIRLLFGSRRRVHGLGTSRRRPPSAVCAPNAYESRWNAKRHNVIVLPTLTTVAPVIRFSARTILVSPPIPLPQSARSNSDSDSCSHPCVLERQTGLNYSGLVRKVARSEKDRRNPG